MLSRHLYSGIRTAARRRFASTVVSGLDSRIATVLGAQWGDEGKGKLVDVLAQSYNIVARFNGGANAGHTLKVGDKTFAFHLLPCGMLNPKTLNVLGNGVVVDLPVMFGELKELSEAGINHEHNLKISDRAHLLFEFHKIIDGLQESQLKDKSIGTTKRGIGPCYATKALRNGLRVGELVEDFDQFSDKYLQLVKTLQDMYKFDYDPTTELSTLKSLRERIKPMVTDTVFLLNNEYNNGKRILAEGANALMLDVEFGTYPFVTSSATSVGGISTGLGIAPNKIDAVIGVVKAYTTRVGWGPFPSELTGELGDHLQSEGHEFGATTARKRRCGWLDIPLVKYSAQINGYQSINLTKLDVLSKLKEIKIATNYIDRETKRVLQPGEMPSTLNGLGRIEVQYETVPGWECDISSARKFTELPANAQLYVSRCEELMGLPISWIGVGPDRDDMVTKGFEI